ncbi:uncharacterized protein CC84DRAFT_756882 [Paraphaeosphaeria sporulosa]|uniref:Prion-inhibition and propagation HeLo domain-containing protein n=1 Tax=Paraphaeosphaeria sporulosa TaxID=1460663 RepID=A0A177CFA5_9PLEO|nr:uncharacterized protein CC84DRAFT_756882 [Paraphaeosphaeria sporulosa]OAG06294.1 hypothetical protein CC84DRAFT_756882 [Paraphaeosphaeria sporulosa]
MLASWHSITLQNPHVSLATMAAPFTTCVECFETFSQGRDFSHLLVELDFEKTQLLLWGNSSGILKAVKKERHPSFCRLDHRRRS